MSLRDVRIVVNDRELRVEPGITIAAALLNAGVQDFRTSVTGAPRAALCGMGVCFECRVTVDDVAQQRACLIAVRDGMRVRTGGEHA
jgi:sarcosine oxidase subunit alpha